MFDNFVRGSLAGAAGTTALNAVSYADMTVRGRPSSDTPEETMDRLSSAAHLPVRGDHREARLSGLGGLAGTAVGCGIGACVGLAFGAGVRPPLWLGTLATAALTMAVVNSTLAWTGVSDPRTWSASDWVSDAVPHLVYGLTTYGGVLAGTQRP